jgi:hypothetical protein
MGSARNAAWGWHGVSMGWNGVGMGRMGPHGDGPTGPLQLLLLATYYSLFLLPRWRNLAPPGPGPRFGPRRLGAPVVAGSWVPPPPPAAAAAAAADGDWCTCWWLVVLVLAPCPPSVHSLPLLLPYRLPRPLKRPGMPGSATQFGPTPRKSFLKSLKGGSQADDQMGRAAIHLSSP